MKSIPETEILRPLPLQTDGAGSEKAYGKHRFVRAYKERGGADGNSQKLDPVLAAHLGLTEGDRG